MRALMTRRLKALLCVSLLAVPATLAMTPSQAQAFCGFYVSGADAKLYNNATMVVMMREGTKTVLSMQNNYEGPPQDFAMVVPVPVVLKEENVKILNKAIFDKVDNLASPRLVEYFEQDPCYIPPPMPKGAKYDVVVRSSAPPRPSPSPSLGVKIEAQFDVGEYNVVVLSAKESNGLETWLTQNKYNIPTGAAPAMKPYIEQGMYFFVAKVDIKKVKKETLGGKEQVVLSPLRFHYDTDNFSLPVRLGLLNAQGKQDLLVHILAKEQRYELANRKNVTIPTNLIVDQSVRKRFGEFYASLFDYTLEENPGSVVTEYAWDASTCDPCPGPTLDGSDMLSLGGDVIGGAQNGFNWGSGWVLTRLHARYSADELKDDLVFKKAEAIVGGRGTPVGLEGKLDEQGSKPFNYNNFQGRYIMLNPWKGEIKCDNPQRGSWGGGPDQAVPAQDIAFAPRGELKLEQTVARTAPGLEKLKLTSAQTDAANPVKAADPAAPQTPDAAAPKNKSCSSTGAGSPLDAPSVLLMGLGFWGLARRRRR